MQSVLLEDLILVRLRDVISWRAGAYLRSIHSRMPEVELSPKFAPFFGMVCSLLVVTCSDSDRYVQGGIAFAVSLRTPDLRPRPKDSR